MGCVRVVDLVWIVVWIEPDVNEDGEVSEDGRCEEREVNDKCASRYDYNKCSKHTEPDVFYRYYRDFIGLGDFRECGVNEPTKLM